MEIIQFIKVVILGMVEGLTEFAPVSSTGHMIIVDDMWLQSEKFLGKYVANTFKVVIQLGSILAVVVVFKDRFIELLGLNRKKGEKWNGTFGLKLSQVIVGLLPAGILGLLFEDYIDTHLFTTETVLVGLVLGAILMVIADLFGEKKPTAETVDQITYRQAFATGLFQCFSLWPGFSRSGSTISGGVLLGMSHRAAADFSFIMAVPIMAGASGLSLLKNLSYFQMADLPYFIAGFLSAFVVALVTIRFFLKMINRVKLIPFAIYRVVLAAVIYVLWF